MALSLNYQQLNFYSYFKSSFMLELPGSYHKTVLLSHFCVLVNIKYEPDTHSTSVISFIQ